VFPLFLCCKFSFLSEIDDQVASFIRVVGVDFFLQYLHFPRFFGITISPGFVPKRNVAEDGRHTVFPCGFYYLSTKLGDKAKDLKGRVC